MMNTDTFRLDDIVESIDINEASEKMNINVDNIINDKTLAQHGIEKGSKIPKLCLTQSPIMTSSGTGARGHKKATVRDFRTVAKCS